jgi:hypothetical protein
MIRRICFASRILAVIVGVGVGCAAAFGLPLTLGQASDAVLSGHGKPSLPETITYIKNEVATHGCTSFEVKSPDRDTLVNNLCTRIQKVDGSNLTFVYSIGQGSESYSPPPMTTIDLSTLDPTSVKLDIFPVPYPPATRGLDGYRILISHSDGGKGERYTLTAKITPSI